MLDKIALRIFIKPDFYVGSERDGYLLTKSLLDLGLKTASRDVYKDENGKIQNRALFTPYETLPTSYTGMAFKFFHEGFKTGKGEDAKYFPPFIELKCSPAKILQGHNVFGTDRIIEGAKEMLGWLHIANPYMFNMLDVDNAMVLQFDVTYSARLENSSQVDKVLAFMRNVSSRGLRKAEDRAATYKNTVYWGSQRCKRLARKMYNKAVEFNDQLQEQIKLSKKNDKCAMRVVEVMQDPRLQQWANGLLRLETGMKAYWLAEQGLPLKLFDLIDYQENNPDFLKDFWIKANAEVFKALEGEHMKLVNDDSVEQLLISTYQTVTNNGKISNTRANNLFRFYRGLRDYGVDEMKRTFTRTQYFKNMADLIAAGIPKAVLQNLHEQKDSNVIKFVELIKIDFANQVPDWYEEPISQFSLTQQQTKLRLVS